MLRFFSSILLLLVYLSLSNGLEKTCAPDQFTCKVSGVCIKLSSRCDLYDDCDDGSDEQGCPKTTCAEGYFRCDDGQCIPQRWLCDNSPDCGDESDEAHSICQNKSCDGYRCQETGACIPDAWKCDGKADCTLKDDENDCDHVCEENEFQCKDQLKCIDKSWNCDGHNDCDDGSDELNCQCGEDEFVCDSDSCINKQWVCDGDFDCDDKSDEQNCAVKELINQTCGPTMFQCDTPLNKPACIAESWRCDGDPDCTDESDEKNCEGIKTCPSDEMLCVESNYCVKKEFLCDREEDCQDGSDEKNCTYSPVTPTPNCAANQFDCFGDGTKCISDKYRCDVNDDCGNYADEKDCPKNNSCLSTPNGGCQHICSPTATGHVCECNPGFQLASGSETNCEDIDECKVHGTCSQICINRKGTYKCECGEGYFLTDHRYCKADTNSHPELIFTDSYDIRRYELSTYHYKLLLDKKDLSGAVIVDYDIRKNMVYWTGPDNGGYVAANLETGDMQTIKSDQVNMPDGLAVDWVHGNMYISDTGHNHIVVFRLDKTYSKVLLSEDLDEPRAIVIDPYHGWMYFTDWGTEPKIEKCGMNGKDRKVIVTEHIAWPNGLAIDYVDNRLYWVDAKMHHIGSTNLDGGDFRHVLKGHRHLGHPFAITVFEDYMYWTDWIDNAVHKMSKFGTGNITTIAFDLKTPYDIRVYHIYRQPARINHCGGNYGGCSHFCLPLPQYVSRTQVMKKSECACPEGMVLEDDYNCVDSAEKVTAKPAKPSGSGNKDGNQNRPHTSKNKPTTFKPTEPVTAGPNEDKHSTEKHNEVTVHYVETTEKPRETTEEKHTNGTVLSHQDTSSTAAVGHVAGIAIAAIAGACVFIAIVIIILVRRYKKKNVRSMNFDNPVYRKTTTDDQLIMDKDSANSGVEKESMQPLNQEPEIV